MKRLGLGAFWLGMTTSFSVRAQPQADAALADDPREKDSLTRWRTERAGAESAAAEPPLTTAQLRATYPDLELSATPHRRLALFIGPLAPFQVFALGLSSDIYVVPRFRVSGFLSGGAIKNSQESRISMYGEAGFGVVVARWRRTTTITLPVPSSGSSLRPLARGRSTALEEPRVQRGVVPVSHSLEVELGAISAYYPLYRCVADCATSGTRATLERFDSSQLFIPFGGLRYGYYRWARSLNTPFRSTQRFEVAVDLLTKPINNPPRDLLNGEAKPIKQSTVGTRVTLRLPGIQTSPNAPALAFDVVAGYLPSPEDVILQFNITVL